LNKLQFGEDGWINNQSSHIDSEVKCDKFVLQIPKSEDINLKSPTDMSYVFSGAYSPLSCKLVEQVS
jgi:beta-lactamase regulating signal transducer with metallopeptidase domain